MTIDPHPWRPRGFRQAVEEEFLKIMGQVRVKLFRLMGN
jgi:hypothetical protein